MEDMVRHRTGRFDFVPTLLQGLWVVQRKPVEDHRGFFSRLFCAEEFQAIEFGEPVAQVNHSFTERKGTVRGMHFQYPPYTEAKIISCLRGEVYDVAVDIRKGSPSFLHWHGEILSEANQRGVVIPKGFAHGFQTLSEDCILVYLVSELYRPQSESALHVADPRIGIVWPLALAELSERDGGQPFIDSSFEGLAL